MSLKWNSVLIISLVLLILSPSGACVNLSGPQQMPLTPPTASDNTQQMLLTPPAASDNSEQIPLTPPYYGRYKHVYQVQVDFVPSKTVYMPWDNVNIGLVVANKSTDPLIVILPPKVTIYALTNDFDTGIVVHTFPAGMERQMSVGEVIRYNLTWDQKDENGNQVLPGWYFMKEVLHQKTAPEEHGVDAAYSSRVFLIQYPQGAMLKTIELNQSATISELPLTVEGQKILTHLVFTLDRVELTDTGAIFIAEAVLPEFHVGWYNSLETLARYIDARYVIDGIYRYPRIPRISGPDVTWGSNRNCLDPVPRDARQLSFILTRFGDWHGYLEFPIPLY